MLARELRDRSAASIFVRDSANRGYLRENHVPVAVICSGAREAERRTALFIRHPSSKFAELHIRAMSNWHDAWRHTRRVASVRASVAIQHNVKRRTTPRRRFADTNACIYKVSYIRDHRMFL